MLEAGVLNLPVDTFSLRQGDMTMKMLGLSQTLPFPGIQFDPVVVEAFLAEGETLREMVNLKGHAESAAPWLQVSQTKRGPPNEV